MIELKIIETEIKISLERFNSKYKESGKSISKHKLQPQRFCKPTNQEKKNECGKMKSFLESGSPLSTLTYKKMGVSAEERKKAEKNI